VKKKKKKKERIGKYDGKGERGLEPVPFPIFFYDGKGVGSEGGGGKVRGRGKRPLGGENNDTVEAREKRPPSGPPLSPFSDLPG